ncbi:E3 ubiquitin-protein ligase KCMF1-like isoform X2 [Amblyomma americanum]
MSRHEGVSCDSCMKANFRGKRYKCLICYDYDLCGTCYEAGATNTRHTPDHAMQCILTRSDFDLYYGGEAVSVEQPQSFTCPICGKMGFTELTLQEHASAEHTDASSEVVCPVCAALPGGEPNHVTEDFATHLSLEHRANRDLDEPSGSRHVRRIPHPAGRGMSSARARRSQMQFSSTGGLSALSPSNRDSMDPIAELLSQLSSGVRRTATLAAPSTTSQIQQLQMQLQLERQQAQAARQQLERLPRRQAHLASPAAAAATLHCPQAATTPALAPSTEAPTPTAHFLLSRCVEPSLLESEQQALELERTDRSLFAQELLLTTLAERLHWPPGGAPWPQGTPATSVAATSVAATTPPRALGEPEKPPAERSSSQQQPDRGLSREGGRLSPSRRKVVRVLDERNKLKEPPH